MPDARKLDLQKNPKPMLNDILQKIQIKSVQITLSWLYFLLHPSSNKPIMNIKQNQTRMFFSILALPQPWLKTVMWLLMIISFQNSCHRNLIVSMLLAEKVHFYMDLHESSDELFHLVESNAQQWKSRHYIKSSHLGLGGKLTIIFVIQTLLKHSLMALRHQKASHEEIPAVSGEWPVLTNGTVRAAAVAAQRSGWVGLFLHFLPQTDEEGL